MNRERGDVYLQLTQSRWVRFANLGDFEYFCRVADAPVGDCQAHAVDPAPRAPAMKPATGTGWAMKAV